MGIMSIPCCDIVVKPPAPRIPGGPILVRAGWYHFLVLSNTGFVSTFIASPPLEAIENPSIESLVFDCDAATTANIGITYNNGVLGRGAYIIGETGITLDGIDGVTLALRDKYVLVKNQTLETENGIYQINTIGSSTTPWKMIRDSRFPNQRFDDQTIGITQGHINAKLSYYVKDYDAVNGICFGVDAINFSLIKNDYWTEPFARHKWKEDNKNLRYPLAETGMRDDTLKSTHQGLDNWQCADCTRNVESFGISGPTACLDLSVIDIQTYGTIYMAFPGAPCFSMISPVSGEFEFDTTWPQYARTESKTPSCAGKCAYHNAYTDTWYNFLENVWGGGGAFNSTAREIKNKPIEQSNVMGQVQPFLDMNGQCNELGVTLYYDTGKKDKDGDEIILSSFETPNNLARIAPPGHPLETPVSVNTRPIVDIECGAYHNIVRFNDNTIMAWGLNSMGQTNVPESLLPDWLRPTGVSKHPKINKICSIHAGFSTSAVLFNDGTVLCWGDPEVADKVNTWKHIRTSPIKILDGSQNQCIGSPSSGFPVCLPGENCAQAENWVPANKYENGSWNANHDWDQEWKSHKTRSPAHPHFDLGTETQYVYPVNYDHVILTDEFGADLFLHAPEIDLDTNSESNSPWLDTHPQYSYRYAQKWRSDQYQDVNGNPISRCAAKGKIKKDFAVAMLRTGQIITTRTEEAPKGRDKVGLCRDCDNDGKLHSEDLMGVYSSQGPSIDEGCRTDSDLSDICEQDGSCECPNPPQQCDSSTRLMVTQILDDCATSTRPQGIGCFGSDNYEGNYNPNWALFNDPWKSAGHAKGTAEGGLNPFWNTAEANVGWASLPMPQVRFSVPLQNIKSNCKASRTYFNKCSSWFGMNDPCYTECHSIAINGNAHGTPGGGGGGQHLGSYGYFDMPEHMMSFGCVAGTNAVTWHKSALTASSGIMNYTQAQFNNFTSIINGDHTVQSGLKMSQLSFTTSRGGPCGICRFNGSDILHFPFDNLCNISTGVIFNWPKQDGDQASNPLSNFCPIRPGGYTRNNAIGGSLYKVSRPWGPVQLSTVVGFLPFSRQLDSFIWNYGVDPFGVLEPHLLSTTLNNSFQPGTDSPLAPRPISRNNPNHLIIEPQWFRTFDYVMNEPNYSYTDNPTDTEDGSIAKQNPTFSAYDSTACDCSSLCWGSNGENLGNDILVDGLGCMTGGDIDDKPICNGAYQFNCYSEPPLKYDPKGSILQKPGQGYTLYGPRFDVDNTNNQKNSSVILNEFSLDLDGTKIITISETINAIFYINIWENKKPDIDKPKKLLQRHKIDITTILKDTDVLNRFQENVSQLKVINNNEILLQLTSMSRSAGNENVFIVISDIYTARITTKIIKFLTARSSNLVDPLGKSTFDISKHGCYSEDSEDGDDFGSNPLILKSRDSTASRYPVISFSLRTPESKFRIAVIHTKPKYGSASGPGTIKVYEECSSVLTPNFDIDGFILDGDKNQSTADTNKYIYFISIAKIKNEDISNTARYSQLNKVFDQAQFPGPTLGIEVRMANGEDQTVEDENLASAGGETIDHLLISDDGTTLIAGLRYTRTLAFWKFSSDVSFPINPIFVDNGFEIIYTNLKLNDNNYAQICSIKFESNIFVKVNTEGTIISDSPLWSSSTASYGVNYWANLVQFNTDNSIAALWGYSNDYKGDGSEEHSRPDLRSSCSNHANVVERYNLTYGATAGYITNTIQSTQNKKIFIWKGSFFNYYNGWDDTFAHEKHTIRFNKTLTHLAVISHNKVSCGKNENVFEPKHNLLYVDIENNKYKLITSDVFYGLRGAELSSVCIHPKYPNLVLLSNDNDTKLIKTPWNWYLDGSDPPIDYRYINPNLNMIDMTVDYAENSMDLWPRRMCGKRACVGKNPPKGWTGGGWWGCSDQKGKANVVNGDKPRFPDLNKSSDGCSECDGTNEDKRSRWGWGNRVISYATGRSWSVNLRALPYNRDRDNASLFLRKAHCREANEWGLDEFLKTNNQYDGKAYCHRINNYDNVKIWVTGSMIDPCPPWPLQDWKSDLDIDIPLPPLNPNKPDSVMYTVTNELNPNGLTALNGSTGFMKIQPSAQYPSWVPVPAESNYAYKGVWKKIGTTWTWLQGLLRINNGKVDGTELRGISAINYTDMLNITNSVGISGAYQYIKGITLTERTWTEEKPKYNPTKNIFAQSIHFGWDGPDEYYGGDDEIKLLYPRTACTELSQYFGSCRSHNGCIQTTKAECKEFDRISRLDSGRGVTWTSQASCNGEPSITSITPNEGSIGGGEEIRITGKDFHL